MTQNFGPYPALHQAEKVIAALDRHHHPEPPTILVRPGEGTLFVHWSYYGEDPERAAAILEGAMASFPGLDWKADTRDGSAFMGFTATAPNLARLHVSSTRAALAPLVERFNITTEKEG